MIFVRRMMRNAIDLRQPWLELEISPPPRGVVDSYQKAVAMKLRYGEQCLDLFTSFETLFRLNPARSKTSFFLL
jgi:hypothetical protein